MQILSHFKLNFNSIFVTSSALIFTLFISSANAQSSGSPAYQTYVGVNILKDIITTQEQVRSPIGNSNNFAKGNIGKPTTMMIHWGYREQSTYGFEVGYLNTLNSTSKSDNGIKYEQSAKGLFASLLFFFPITNEASIYAKVGTGKLSIESVVTSGGKTYSKTEKKMAPSFGFGIEYLMSSNIAIRGGWEIIETKTSIAGKTRHSGINIGGNIFY